MAKKRLKLKKYPNGGKLKYLPPDVSRASFINPFGGGSESEYKSGYDINNKEVTLPTVWQDPPFVQASPHSDNETIDRFNKTGEHMGIHNTWQEGDIDAWRRTAKYNFLSNPVESAGGNQFNSYPKLGNGGQPKPSYNFSNLYEYDMFHPKYYPNQQDSLLYKNTFNNPPVNIQPIVESRIDANRNRNYNDYRNYNIMEDAYRDRQNQLNSPQLINPKYQDQQSPEFKDGGQTNNMKKIHINPKNRGKFNALKKKTGKSTEELTHSSNPLTRKRAVFAQNASHWNHKKDIGGYIGDENLPMYLNGTMTGNQEGYDWGANNNQFQAPPAFNINMPEYQRNQNQFNPNFSQSDNYYPDPSTQSNPNKDNLYAQGRSQNNFRNANYSGFNPYQGQYESGNYFTNAAHGLNEFAWNIGKGIPDLIGTDKQNRNINAFKNNQFYNQQSGAFKTPFSTQNTNPGQSRSGGLFKHGGMSKYADGGVDINNYNTNSNPNSEVEGQEMGVLPNGLAGEFHGPSHDNGGIPTNLPEGSKILSEKLKDPSTKKSFAKLAKKFSTEKDMETLQDKDATPLNKETARMNITFKNKELNELFLNQENEKISGTYGDDIKKKAMLEHGLGNKGEDTPGVEQEGVQDESNSDVPQGKYGMKVTMKKYDSGGKNFTRYSPETQALIDKGELVPANQNLDPISKMQHNLGSGVYSEKGKPFDMSDFYQRHPWVKEEYNNYNTQKGSTFNPRDPQDVNWFQNMYDHKYNDWRKSKGLPEQNYFQNGKNNPYGIDSKFGQFTYATPGFTPASEAQANAPETPQGDKVAQGAKLQLGDNSNRQYNDGSPFAVPIPLFGQNYNIEPIGRNKYNPNLINYRQPDIEPQINEINRSSRSLSRYLPTTASGIGQRSQFQANSLNSINQAYGQYNNQVQQGRQSVDQFNANQLDQNQSLQNQENSKVQDLYLREKGAVQQQKNEDRVAAIENSNRLYMGARQEAATRSFLDRVYPWATPQGQFEAPTNTNLNPYTQTQSETDKSFTRDARGKVTGEVIAKKKMGGKITLKKKKSK